jgi:hypothetical protein
MRSRRNPPTCACGCTYEDFRLGMSFGEVRRMMWDQEDRNRPGWWRQKRRSGVLGFARELKLHAWDTTHRYCEMSMEAAA